MKGALDLQQQAASDERREGEENHRCGYQNVPGVKRDEINAHARWAGFQHPDDHFYGGSNGGHLDEREAEQPDIRADPRLILGGQRRVHEPATARRGIEEQRATEEYPAKQEGKKAKSRQTRKGQIARPQHLRQEHDRNGFEDRQGKQEHHHRAVQREDLVVKVGGEQRVAGYGKLQADQ